MARFSIYLKNSNANEFKHKETKILANGHGLKLGSEILNFL
jgi:hypothetical protein